MSRPPRRTIRPRSRSFAETRRLRRRSLFLRYGLALVLLPGCSSLPDRVFEPAFRSFRSAMALVPAGRFEMGSLQGRADERPLRTVWVDAFYMDETPITYAQFEAYIDAGAARPPYYHYESYNRPEQPVTGISWVEAACFLNWQSRREARSPVYDFANAPLDDYGYPVPRIRYNASGYRLPTEAEFERAARGSSGQLRYPWGDAFSSELANYDMAHGFTEGEGRWWRLAPVREQFQNDFGLYGLAGNVWEWTNDIYEPHYDESAEMNPRGPGVGSARTMRGGSWGSPHPNDLRVSRRARAAAGHYNYDIGFRAVLPARFANLPADPDHRVAADPECGRARPAPRSFPTRAQFINRLARYLEDFFSESIYFNEPVDQQAPLSAHELARIIVDVSESHGVNPLFLVGVMKSESGFGTVSYPRWFNNPMAFHWANWKMAYGAPRYDGNRNFNRRFAQLDDGFAVFSRGLNQAFYRAAARRSFYDFHIIYVGGEALEWMNGVGRVYRDVIGINPVAGHQPAFEYIYGQPYGQAGP